MKNTKTGETEKLLNIKEIKYLYQSYPYLPFRRISILGGDVGNGMSCLNIQDTILQIKVSKEKTDIENVILQSEDEEILEKWKGNNDEKSKRHRN